jgi:hypothetical protein
MPRALILSVLLALPAASAVSCSKAPPATAPGTERRWQILASGPKRCCP